MNTNYSDVQKGIQYLKSQGIDTKQMDQAVRMQQGMELGNSMSFSDGMYIQRSEPDAPGVYISQDQKMQDAFAQELAMKDQRNERPTVRQQFIPEIADITMGNPNYRTVAGPQRVTIGPNGQMIYL